jgi:hypothetical protein
MIGILFLLGALFGGGCSSWVVLFLVFDGWDGWGTVLFFGGVGGC